MATKPPRLDLAAAMEAELSADALGPRSAWGTPPSTSANASHATHGLPSSETEIQSSQETVVPPPVPPPVTSSPETVRPVVTETHDASALETVLPPSHVTPSTTSLMRAEDDNPTVTLDPSPMRQQDDATIVLMDRSEGRLLKPSTVPPSRQGAVRISAYCSGRVMKQVRMMAVNQDCTIDDLVTRALDLLFKAEGLPAIAFDGKPFGRPQAGSEKGAG